MDAALRRQRQHGLEAGRARPASVAPGPGASSPGDVASEEQAAAEAGEQAAGFAGVDAERAAPIARDDTDALAQPGTASAEPGGATPKE